MVGGSAPLVPSLRNPAVEPDNRLEEIFRPVARSPRVEDTLCGAWQPAAEAIQHHSFGGRAAGRKPSKAMEDDISNRSDEDTGDWTDRTPTFGLSGSVPEIAPRSLQGKTIADRYEIGELVGTGGFSLVFQGRDTREQLEREVAIKIPRYPGEPAARVARGGKLNGQLDHHYIAKLFDAGVFDEGKYQVPYMILELVTGARSLTAYCREVELPLRQRLEMFIKVCDAVGSAHAIGVIHRDLKPGNILVNNAGEPRVIDFDTAREMVDGDQAAAVANGLPLPAAADRQAATGIAGTLIYMAPEQRRGDQPSRASDVFSLGLVLFEIASGLALPGPVTPDPTAAETPGSLLPSLEEMTTSARLLPRSIRQICQRCLESKPADRFVDAAALARAVRQAAERMTPERIASRRRMFGLTAAVAVVVLILAGLIGSSAWQWWLRQAYVKAVGNAAVAFSSPEGADSDLATLLENAESHWQAWQGNALPPSELTLLRALGQGRQTELAWATTSAVFVDDGRRLAAGDRLGNLVLATSSDPATPEDRLSGIGGPFKTLLGGAGSLVVTLDTAGSLASWPLGEPREPPWQPIAELTSQADWAVALSPDANLLAAASDQTLEIWEKAAGGAAGAFTLAASPELLGVGAAVVSSVCFGAESAGLLVGMTDGTVLVLDRRTGAERSRFTLGGQEPVTLRRSVAGERLAAFAVGGPLRLLDPDTGGRLEAAVAATPPIHEAMLTDAGRRLLVLSHPNPGTGESTTVRVFDTTVPRGLDFLSDFQMPGTISQLAIANGRVCLADTDGAVWVADPGGQ